LCFLVIAEIPGNSFDAAVSSRGASLFVVVSFYHICHLKLANAKLRSRLCVAEQLRPFNFERTRPLKTLRRRLR
jgi:hypothetical protein